MEEESDRAVFSRMARANSRMMLVYARTLLRDEVDARELVQESLVTAWENMNRFDVTRDVGAWLRGIVRNKWREHCRRVGSRPDFAVSDPAALEAELSSWHDEAEKPLFEALQECRDLLPEALADAVQAFYYDGMNGAEASEQLGVNAATLRKRLERARLALHQCLQSKS
jgi:RNA polymerase sigma-70 factor (ECF subfamily)